MDGQINNELSIAIEEFLLHLCGDLKFCVDVLKQILLFYQFHIL